MTRASIAIGSMAGAADARRAAYLMVPVAAWRTVAGTASRIAAWYVRRQQIRRNTEALSHLSDRMLKDIGIDRCAIERVARFGRDATDLRS